MTFSRVMPGAGIVRVADDKPIINRTTGGSAQITPSAASYVQVAEAPLNASRYATLADGVAAAADVGSGRQGALYIPPGAYTVTATIATPENYAQPTIFGANAKGTIITKSNSGPIFRFVGGSGDPAVAALSDVSLRGSTATGIEFRGSGAMNAYRIDMRDLAGGVQFHNSAASTFTEFCIVHDSRISNTDQPVEYKVTSGNNSFHGSGLSNVLINQKTAKSVILVGSGCKVYSAPMDVWLQAVDSGTALVKILSATTLPLMTHGTIRVEGAGQLVDDASTSTHIHAGGTQSIDQAFSLGKKFVLARSSQLNVDGSTSIMGLEKNVQTTLSNAGAPGVEIAEIGFNGSYLVSVYIDGPNYYRDRLLHVFRNLYDADGAAVAITSGADFDAAGHGVPIFTVSGGKLYVRATSTAYTTSVKSYVNVKGLGLSRTATIFPH